MSSTALPSTLRGLAACRASGAPGCRRSSALARPRHAAPRPRRTSSVAVSAESLRDRLAGALKAAEPVVDAAASLVPSSVPRPAARAAAVALAGGASLWLLSTLLNTALTLVLLAGFAFAAYTWSSGGGGKGGKAGGGGSSDEDDPLERARKARVARVHRERVGARGAEHGGSGLGPAPLLAGMATLHAHKHGSS